MCCAAIPVCVCVLQLCKGMYVFCSHARLCMCCAAIQLRIYVLQLCKGVSAEEAEQYRLPAEPMQDFNYLNQSGCSSIEGVDDATDFATLKSAMTAVGIQRQQQTEVFEVLAGILWLGNIQFSAPTDDSVSVEPGPAVSNAAALLQISEAALVNALTRSVVLRALCCINEVLEHHQATK